MITITHERISPAAATGAETASVLPSAARLSAGLAALRVIVGTVFLAHGAQKLFVYGPGYFAIVELHAPWRPEVIEPLGAALRHLDMVNSYVCYNRG